MHRYPTTAIARLRQLAPFAGCTNRQLARIDSLMTTVAVPAGRVLTRQGDPGRECYLVERGAIAVVRNGSVIDELGPGSWAGELALLTGGLRTATLSTATDTVLYAMNRREFATLLAGVPSVAAAITHVARHRLGSHSLPTEVPQPLLALA